MLYDCEANQEVIAYDIPICSFQFEQRSEINHSDPSDKNIERNFFKFKTFLKVKHLIFLQPEKIWAIKINNQEKFLWIGGEMPVFKSWIRN